MTRITVVAATALLAACAHAAVITAPVMRNPTVRQEASPEPESSPEATFGGFAIGSVEPTDGPSATFSPTMPTDITTDAVLPSPSEAPSTDGGIAGGVFPGPGAVTDGAGAATDAATSAQGETDTSIDRDFPGVESPEPTEEDLGVSPDSEEDDDDSVCFNDAATVQLEDGSVKRMDAVQLGDRVKVSSGGFSDVFMFTHKSADVVNKFVKLSTSAGAELTLTSGHFLYVNGALSAAKTVKVGDSLELGSGDRTTVESVESVLAKGLYNPQTINGDIIVNNIRASTYTTTIEPTAAHAMLAPLRAVFKVFGFTTAVFDNGLDSIKTAL